MADPLYNVLPTEKITKQNLIDQMFAINKKFVMIDSRAYTEDAFEYVLKLADLQGALVFVYDTQKIWANGRFFGGDVFQHELRYYSDILSSTENGIITGQTKANTPQSNLVIMGKSHVKTSAIYDENLENPSILSIDYDLDSAVNRNQVKIGESYYNLIVEDGQIKLNEYIPINITCSPLPVLEYDSGNTIVEIQMNITGTLAESGQVVTNVNASIDIPMHQEGSLIRAEIPNNTNVDFVFTCSDGISESTCMVSQKWGYPIYVGVFFNRYEDDIDNIDISSISANNMPINNFNLVQTYLWVPGSMFFNTITLKQEYKQYGIIICPKMLDFEITDVSTNLSGGWSPIINANKNLYRDIEYNVIQTDNTNLGLVTWNLKSL